MLIEKMDTFTLRLCCGDGATLIAWGKYSRELATMMFETCLRLVLFRNKRPVCCVLRDFEQCFVKASCTAGLSNHLSSDLVEAAFELERINTNHRNKTEVVLVRFITSYLRVVL